MIARVAFLLLPAALCVAGAAYAQAPFQILHELNGSSEGRNPSSPLIEASDGNFYGTTVGGGIYNWGTIFRVTLAGDFTTVYNFSAGYDGGVPFTALVQADDGNLYGTTTMFGAFNEGIIFRLGLDGAFTILHAFNRGLDAGQPRGPLVQAADGHLYGTTIRGGAFDRGTIFRATLEGDVTVLHSFGGTPNAALPFGGLIRGNDGNLYGTSGDGSLRQTVFRFTPHAFTGLVVVGSVNIGVWGFTLAGQGPDGSLFGSAPCGQYFGTGGVFRMSLAGTVTVLASFATSCSDSAAFADVNLAFGKDGRLYGTVSGAYSYPDSMGDGVFAVAPEGGITPLVVFNISGGARPWGQGVTQGRDGMLYGATYFGGAHGAGTVFRVTPVARPPVSLLRTTSGQGDVRLRWALVATAASYTIKRATSTGAETVLATGLTTASYVDTSAIRGQRYYYIVTAVNQFGESVASYEVSITAGTATVGDFDGDGASDVTVFRPSTGTWSIQRSSTATGDSHIWGGTSDIPVPADYDGDGTTDTAVFRPSTGTWYVRNTETPTSTVVVWGGGDDVPVPADYDGDGKTDIAVFRPSTGTWYIRDTATPTKTVLVWGGGDDVPTPGDYDGDGKSDIAVFRLSSGTWYVRNTGTPTGTVVVWGGAGDLATSVDYDGDGKADIAVFRPSTDRWYIRNSATPTSTVVVWGGGSDVPVPGDYDGDGRADIAVFRPSTGTWYIRNTGTPTSTTQVWGGAGDIPNLKRP